jgi:hypothetical protein
MGGKKIIMPGGGGGTYAIYLTAQIEAFRGKIESGSDRIPRSLLRGKQANG